MRDGVMITLCFMFKTFWTIWGNLHGLITTSYVSSLWDPVYPVSVYFQTPYRQAQNNGDMKWYNEAFSEARIAV